MSQDVLFVGHCGPIVWFALADGVGGQAGGREAAELVCGGLSRLMGSTMPDPFALQELLMDLDGDLFADPAAGLTTAIVGAIGSGVLVGASVGDSELWLLQSDHHEVVTRHQYRRPMLGSGVSMPIVFESQISAGMAVLIGTDGLFASATPAAILQATRHAELDVVLVELQALQAHDDMAIIVVRR